MPIAKVSAKGWIVILADYRKRYHIQSGDKVQIIDYGSGMSIIPHLDNPVKNAKGILKGDSSLIGSLLVERKKERTKDNGRGKSICS